MTRPSPTIPLSRSTKHVMDAHDRVDTIAMCILCFVGGIAIYLAVAARAGAL